VTRRRVHQLRDLPAFPAPLVEVRHAGSFVAVMGATGSRSVEKHVSAIFIKLDLPAADGDNRQVLAVLRHLNAGP
jgi:hypothetical protein